MYAILLFFHVSAFIYAYRIDELDILQLASHTEYIPFFKYMAFIGVVMVGLDVTWSFLDWRNTARENKELKEENTNLKARLYDMEETARKEPSKGV